MNATLTRLTKQFDKAKTAIEEEIAKLPNYGGECDCEEKETYESIHNGEFAEIEEHCLTCGGFIV